MTYDKDHSELDALNREDSAGLSKDPKSNKVQDLDVESVPVLETLTPRVRKRVELLRELQGQHNEFEANFLAEREELEDKYHHLYKPLYSKGQHNELEAKFLAEREELEDKYQQLYKPLYSKRFEIVNGLTEVEGFIDEGDDDASSVRGVPNFWLNAMKTNEVLAEEITDRDEGALQYLEDIKWSRVHAFEGFKGFWLEFWFDTNPYFKNLVLKKTYRMVDEDEPILEKAIGTKIEWYPGKCLTQKLLKKKSRRGGKIIIKTEKCDSFFNFFNPPQVPEYGDDIDEDAAEDLQNELDMDYEIGTTIRDKIIPHAVSWFTGEAAEPEGDEFEAVDDDDEEDNKEDDDEDEEEEDKSK